MTYNMDDMQRFAWKFMEGGSYGANSYAKAELMLRTLKRFMGEELFANMIKDYSQRHWFKHPRPKDFYAVVSEYAEQDMSWFLDQFVYGSGKLDYAIGSIRSQRERQSKGWFDGEFRERAENTSNNTLYRSEVIVRRLGEIKIPVDLLIVFEDGKEVKETWDGMYRWEKFTYTHTSRIKEAIIDPEFKLVLDLNRTNNSMKRKPNTLAPLKWVSNWLLWLQHALEFFTILGG